MKIQPTRSAQIASSTPKQDTLPGPKGQKEQPPGYGLDFADSQLQPVQAMTTSDEQVAPKPAPMAKSNNTGLPDNLKAGVENLSGYSMDDVQVHYNSTKPAEFNALAYAQGTDIHIAPGQEQHLPHEAWHVVQQAQGRVPQTMRLKDGVAVNDDKGLEKEADVMGTQAVALGHYPKPISIGSRNTTQAPEVLQRLSIDDNPIKWNDIRAIKSLKEGKVLLLTDGQHPLVLKVEKAPFEALEVAHKLIPDITHAKVPKIRMLGYGEQLTLSTFLKQNNPSLHKLFWQELESEVFVGHQQDKYIYAMEFVQGTDLEDIAKKGYGKVIEQLKGWELQWQFGQLHAIDLFVGNKDRGLINLGNWKIGSDGNIIALDNADANSYANRFLTQRPGREEERFQIQQDFKETLNKLSDKKYMQQEAEHQFEVNLLKQLAFFDNKTSKEEILKAIKKLSPYQPFVEGMKNAIGNLRTKVSLGMYRGQPWAQSIAIRSGHLLGGPNPLPVEYN